uniref:C2H2-type domain-containing protein n=1 Tax=Branchiostoma floridae TaxID=7739 RepID=C3ZC36_BRAFL|eukprot:XP_002593797.1 hypothetical protein BRAFLDRAFT_75744 [Branchiostoma floridae]
MKKREREREVNERLVRQHQAVLRRDTRRERRPAVSAWPREDVTLLYTAGREQMREKWRYPFVEGPTIGLTVMSVTKKFSRLDSIRRHMLTHTWENPHTCVVCEHKPAKKSDPKHKTTTTTAEKVDTQPLATTCPVKKNDFH